MIELAILVCGVLGAGWLINAVAAPFTERSMTARTIQRERERFAQWRDAFWRAHGRLPEERDWHAHLRWAEERERVENVTGEYWGPDPTLDPRYYR